MEDKKYGEVRVADHVVAVLAGIAAQEVPGIVTTASGLYEDLAKRMSGKSAAKGVHVTIADGETTIEMRVTVRYGTKIHHACRALQEKVKDVVESLTGLHVQQVHVRVDGVEMA